MIGTTRDLYKGCHFRDDLNGEWVRVQGIKQGSKFAQVQVSGEGWINVTNETGLQITGPGRPREEEE